MVESLWESMICKAQDVFLCENLDFKVEQMEEP